MGTIQPDGSFRFDTNYVGAYTGALVLDLRDDPINPHRGLYSELRVIDGSKYAGSQFDYLQLTPEARGFWSIGDTIFAARGRIGAIVGDVPETERYYGGGTSSHRGFSPRRLSPADPSTGIVIGGAAIVETSFEARRPIGEIIGLDIGGVAFLDGGDVTESVGQLDFARLYWATGLGLRYLSPIGPIGLDIAYRLNRTGPNDAEPGSHWNFLFAVGEAF